MTTERTSYTLLHQIGSGSYGKVYKALGPQGLVAIKMVPTNEGDKTTQQAIQSEIDALKAAAHDTVVPLHDVLHHGASLWLVMECADLGSILDIMRRQRACLSAPEIQAVCAAVLHGLEHLHVRGVVHRDVKAANILLTRDGKVKLADFGVASLGAAAGWKPSAKGSLRAKRAAARRQRRRMREALRP